MAAPKIPISKTVAVLNWFTSEQGRNVMKITAGVAGGLTFGVYLLPHTFFLERTKGVVQMYRYGVPVPLDSRLQNRTEQVLKDLKMLEREKKNVNFFTVFGPEVYHKGSTQFRSGAVVGLPVNFTYESIDDVDRSQMQLGHNPNFNWNSEIGSKLVDSLLLSPQAQKFAVAREVTHSNTYYVYANGTALAGSGLAAYSAGHSLNHSLNMYQRPRSHRMALYTVAAALGASLYVMVVDALNLHYDHYVDKEVANTGKEYILGGIEYYQKKIDRNKALRSALGDIGNKMYTVHGNERETLRSRHIPLTARLDYMRERLKYVDPRRPGGTDGVSFSTDILERSGVPSPGNKTGMPSFPQVADKQGQYNYLYTPGAHPVQGHPVAYPHNPDDAEDLNDPAMGKHTSNLDKQHTKHSESTHIPVQDAVLTVDGRSPGGLQDKIEVDPNTSYFPRVMHSVVQGIYQLVNLF